MSTAIIESESVEKQASGISRTEVLVWAATSLFALTIISLIVSAPLAEAHGHPVFASTVYKVFSLICHQIPERSFHVAGHQFAVCSRCTGLYSGFAVAALVYPLARSLKRNDAPRLGWLILAAVPLVIDFALGYFSIWANTHLSRFSTGALFGAAANFYIIPGLNELTSKFGRHFHRKFVSHS